jgi:hypothetical protein
VKRRSFQVGVKQKEVPTTKTKKKSLTTTARRSQYQHDKKKTKVPSVKHATPLFKASSLQE